MIPFPAGRPLCCKSLSSYLPGSSCSRRLIVKLAVMAALATMLARYRRFRHILIFEQRNWPDRLVFAAGLIIPLTAGVVARLLLNYEAADLTLEGALLAGPHRRPLHRRHRRRQHGAARRLRRRVRRPPLRRGLRVRGRWPARGVPEGRHLELLAVRLLQPAGPRLADGARARRQLAGGAARAADRARDGPSGAWARGSAARGCSTSTATPSGCRSRSTSPPCSPCPPPSRSGTTPASSIASRNRRSSC